MSYKYIIYRYRNVEVVFYLIIIFYILKWFIIFVFNNAITIVIYCIHFVESYKNKKNYTPRHLQIYYNLINNIYFFYTLKGYLIHKCDNMCFVSMYTWFMMQKNHETFLLVTGKNIISSLYSYYENQLFFNVKKLFQRCHKK